MPLITLGGDNSLVLKIPSKGDTGWADDFKNEFAQKIVEHDHSGGALGKRVNILTLDNVQQGVTPGNGNALIWDATDEEFKFLNPATTVSPTAFSLTSGSTATPGSLTTSDTAIVPASSSIPIQTNIQSGVTGWFSATGKYKFATEGIFRLSTSVLISSNRDDASVNIIAKKVSGVVTSNVKTIVKKVKGNMPVGSIIAWSASTSPGSDWLRCDGTAVPISGYEDLHDVIGSTYDTHNGLTAPSAGNFRVPNHSGEFLRDVGSDNLSDVQEDATAKNGLDISVTENLTASSTATSTVTDPGHTHTVQNHNGSENDVGVGDFTAGAGATQVIYGSNLTLNSSTTGIGVSTSVNTTIGGSVSGSISAEDSETRPENTKVAYYIKAKNSVIEQIVLTALVEVSVNDELYIAAKASHSEGIEIKYDDADAAGFTLELEKLE